jgi:hypothetical protein
LLGSVSSGPGLAKRVSRTSKLSRTSEPSRVIVLQKDVWGMNVSRST